jgi:ABC-type nitrate/sulfonate/bicarbonate transport system substrate-binding protein
MIDRRTFIAGGAAGLTLAARRPARAASAITTQFQWIKDVQYAGFWFADADGYFRDAGITSTTVAGGPNVSSIAAIVAAGRADIGVDQFERVVDANAAGADMVVIGALYQTDPAGLLSLPAKPVRTAHDIIGKRLGLQQGAKQFIDAILKVNHLPPDYSEIVVGFDPEPLVQGACDAYLCFVTNQPLALAERHVPYVVTTFDALGYVTYAACIFCRRETLKTNRTAVVAYLHALQRGWAANAHDPQRGADLTVQTYGAALGLDEKWQLAVNHAQIPLMESAETRAHGRMWVDTQRISGPIYATLRATGRTGLPDVNRIVDMSLLTDARHG